MRSSIEKAYDKYALAYADYLEERLPQFLLVKFISLLEKDNKVLDAGCAAGRDSIYLAEEGLDVTGIDISTEILKIAEQKSKEQSANIKFKNASIDSTGFEDSSFDGIWCMDTLNHIGRESLETVFREFYRILEHDGILLMSVVAGESEGMSRLEYMDEDVFFAEHNKTEIEAALREFGFKVFDSSSENTDGTIHINIFAKKL